MQTRDQILASKVYAHVQSFGSRTAKGDSSRSKYGSMAHKLPVLIRTAGLAQALAFLEARGDKEQKLLLEHLELTLGQSGLAARSRTVQLGQYMLLTRECLDALLWFKRFAQSLLDVDASEDGESTDGQ